MYIVIYFEIAATSEVREKVQYRVTRWTRRYEWRKPMYKATVGKGIVLMCSYRELLGALTISLNSPTCFVIRAVVQ